MYHRCVETPARVIAATSVVAASVAGWDGVPVSARIGATVLGAVLAYWAVAPLKKNAKNSLT
jgi:hypothetical protein